MLNQKKPKNYVLASGQTRSVAEFVESALKSAGIEGEWQDAGEEISGVYVALPQSTEYLHKKTRQTLVKVNPEFFRPAEVNLLVGDSTPIRKELGWRPRISFDMMVKSMVEYDISIIEDEYEKEKKAKQLPTLNRKILQVSAENLVKQKARKS